MDPNKQVSLFEESNGVLEIKKHSSLVQMNNVTSLQQRKAINSLIRIAKDQLKRNPEARSFSIDLGQIKKLSGIARNDNFELKQSLKALVSLVIEYNILGKEKYERGAFPFLSFVKILGERRGNTAKVTFEFPTPILEAIKRPSMYVKLNMFIRKDLNSKHSLALYEILKDYQNIGRIRIGMDNFRKLVGVKERQYKIYTMLQKRVIDVAVGEINEKTDLKVSYDLENEGRKITAIIFSVHGTTGKQAEQNMNEEITHRLQAMGIREKTANELLEKHDEDYILANIRIVEEELGAGKAIRNVPAYLLKAFEVDFRPLVTEYDRLQKEKKQSRLNEQRGAEDLQKRRTALLKKFEKSKIQQVEGVLSSLDEGTLKVLKGEFLATLQEHPLFKKFLETKGFDSPTIQSQRRNFLAQKHLPKTVSDFDEFLKSEGFEDYKAGR